MEACKIISDDNMILSTPEDKKIFLSAILNPPEPNDKLKKAQLRINKIPFGGN
ncbi:MAG: DUF1778 domain-containing protein [Sphingobacteriales bacterium]